jgi:hypothetical protein
MLYEETALTADFFITASFLNTLHSAADSPYTAWNNKEREKMYKENSSKKKLRFL